MIDLTKLDTKKTRQLYAAVQKKLMAEYGYSYTTLNAVGPNNDILVPEDAPYVHGMGIYGELNDGTEVSTGVIGLLVTQITPQAENFSELTVTLEDGETMTVPIRIDQSEEFVAF